MCKDIKKTVIRHNIFRALRETCFQKIKCLNKSAMKRIFILLLIFFMPVFLSAQKVKIVQVLEPILFVLNTGEWVHLANIQSPDSLSADPMLRTLRRFSLSFIKKDYRKKWFQLQYSALRGVHRSGIQRRSPGVKRLHIMLCPGRTPYRPGSICQSIQRAGNLLLLLRM